MRYILKEMIDKLNIVKKFSLDPSTKVACMFNVITCVIFGIINLKNYLYFSKLFRNVK